MQKSSKIDCIMIMKKIFIIDIAIELIPLFTTLHINLIIRFILSLSANYKAETEAATSLLCENPSKIVKGLFILSHFFCIYRNF